MIAQWRSSVRGSRNEKQTFKPVMAEWLMSSVEHGHPVRDTKELDGAPGVRRLPSARVVTGEKERQLK